MKSRNRVLIAGAGIAGLATAIALRAAGFEVIVYERTDDADTGGSALGLHPVAVRALRLLGLDAEVIAGGIEVQRWELLSWSGEHIGGWPQTKVSEAFGAPSITVPRACLHEALRRALPDGVVRHGSAVAGFHETDAGVEVLLADGTREPGHLLVGADGLRSAVRRQMRGDTPPRSAHFTAWRAVSDERLETPGIATARQVIGAGATFGWWPLPGGRTYWVATLSDEQQETAGLLRRTGSHVHSSWDHARLADSFRKAPMRAAELIEATTSAQVIRTPIFDRPPDAGWSTARTLLIGDAAHPMVPTTGQGGGQALLDAVAVADVLRSAQLGDPHDLAARLRNFEEQRFPVTSRVAQAAWHLGRLHHERDPDQVASRDRRFQDTTEAEWLSRMGLPVPTAPPRSF
ncbi:FAD-dependent monooxygenase [Solwaraspora sp. WMMD406]|uniref:FAD-dependent oxidoreductase n=1 Tax=Solwaraspora sp. WMMD406 TaxID=3016095 RepID=UPI002416D44C|nr:FAD-dependent monooxygenase [Solwaraspora sp. WMMD406]MDG4763518.1 FAD-dependent monooxygenase [Solwaraspora sp. WMMD406]